MNLIGGQGNSYCRPMGSTHLPRGILRVPDSVALALARIPSRLPIGFRLKESGWGLAMDSNGYCQMPLVSLKKMVQGSQRTFCFYYF